MFIVKVSTHPIAIPSKYIVTTLSWPNYVILLFPIAKHKVNQGTIKQEKYIIEVDMLYPICMQPEKESHTGVTFFCEVEFVILVIVVIFFFVLGLRVYWASCIVIWCSFYYLPCIRISDDGFRKGAFKTYRKKKMNLV